ncbi:class I SAM-dependent methyltransferase [Facklamia languida]|uniref:class I SAM-dependent methyltransferase n=1 Tax=Facklamia languida TaxID=82347 RepID=UPI0038CBF8F3
MDIGCGTGGQTITLAKNTASQITAVDMFPQTTTNLGYVSIYEREYVPHNLRG